MPSFSTFALKAAISSAGCAAGTGRLRRCLHGSVYGISYHTAHCAAHARHGAQANTHVGELPHGLVLRHLFCHIEATLLGVGVALLGPLGGLGLGVDDHLLGLRLGID